MRSKNAQRRIEHIFVFLYADYGINIKDRKIIIWFLRCRHAQSCAFISVIELPRIPAYCPKAGINTILTGFQTVDYCNQAEQRIVLLMSIQWPLYSGIELLSSAICNLLYISIFQNNVMNLYKQKSQPSRLTFLFIIIFIFV